MTKEQYFELCEMLQSEPLEDEIPVEINDLPLEVQEAFQVYSILNDNWEGMSGSYLGKNMAGLLDIMDILGIEDRALILNLIKLIDNVRFEFIQTQQQNKKSASK